MALVETKSSRLFIHNVHLATMRSTRDPRELFTVQCTEGIVEKIMPYAGRQDTKEGVDMVDGKGGILIPSLCHSHIHLDKCNILSQCDNLVSGTFQEAMSVTAKAKAEFSFEDLISRGRTLVLDSVKYGTTSMRTHVEVDTTVHLKCVEVGLQLKKEMKDLCDLGVAVFAQEALYTSSPNRVASENLTLLREAAALQGVSAIGSAPYVEPSMVYSHQNIDDILDISLSRNLHVDFHLDYNLDPTSEPLIHYVIRRLRDLDWAARMPGKRVTIGHATRLTLFSSEELSALHDEVKDLPIILVGLPQSDMYMMGRNDLSRPRGTLQVPQLVNHGFDVAISVNNVGNAFTPQGSLDPLSLCTFGVAVYQAGTPEDCHVLLEAVSVASKRAAGFPTRDTLEISDGDSADFLLVHGNDSVQSLVLCPGYDRTVIKAGKVVARKTAVDFIAYRPGV